MFWIGLTGGIASGKSTVSGFLKKSGIPVVDADELARRAVEKGSEALEKIRSHFGAEVLGPDGSLDRGRLGAIVFGDRERLRELESLIHPEVRRMASEARDRLGAAGYDLAVYDVPLLFEKNMRDQFDRVVVVGCSRETQISRLMKRNGLDRSGAEARVASQLDLDVKIKGATDVIWNEGTLPELELQVENLVQKLRKSSSKA